MDSRFQHLLAINRAIAETLDYEEVLRLVVDKTAQLLGARACALLLGDGGGLARVVAWRGIDDAKAAAFAAPLDERINGALRQLLDHQPEDSFVGVPVIHRGEVSGILVVHRAGAVTADGDEEALLTALADQAAIALDHASRYRDLWAAGQLAQRELETAARRKDEFLAMLSHELRNPLAAIVNALEVLRLVSPDDEKLAQVHAIAARQAMHMKRLLDDLLDVSRVTSDRIVLQREPVVLQEVLDQALDGSAPLIEQRRHHLEVDVPAQPLLVVGDADRLVQVVSNLLVNAAKYTQPGGHLRLTLGAEDGAAVVRVRDDGIGIPADLLPSVFDLFVQASRDAHRSEGGLGIGLSLVKRLVEMHGGSVEAASEGPGRGSELVVRLPLADAAVGADERASVAVEACDTARRILLVEDNRDVADLLAEGLRTLGHEVTVAANGETALGRAAARAPDVVLIDIGLPGMDGYELVRRLRQDAAARAATEGKAAPLLVAITGYGSPADTARAREAGFDHHLVKPVELEQLSRLVGRAAAG